MNDLIQTDNPVESESVLTREEVISLAVAAAREASLEALIPVQQIVEGLNTQVGSNVKEVAALRGRLEDHKRLITGPPFKEAIIYKIGAREEWKTAALEKDEQSKESGIAKVVTASLSNLGGDKNFWRIMILIVLVILGILSWRWNGDAHGPGSSGPQSDPIHNNYVSPEEMVP